jgi:hypothetical protein
MYIEVEEVMKHAWWGSGKSRSHELQSSRKLVYNTVENHGYDRGKPAEIWTKYLPNTNPYLYRRGSAVGLATGYGLNDRVIVVPLGSRIVISPYRPYRFWSPFNLLSNGYRRPPLWSGGQSSWLLIQRSGFDSQRYQISWEEVGLERGPLSLVSTTEEILERKSSGSGLENRECDLGIRCADNATLSIRKGWH